MRRSLIIASLVGSLIVFALSIDLFGWLFMFLFFGVTPLRAEPIPALEMLLIYVIVGLAIITFAFRSSVASLLHALHRKPTQAKVS